MFFLQTINLLLCINHLLEILNNSKAEQIAESTATNSRTVGGRIYDRYVGVKKQKKNHKSPGKENITSELIKYEGREIQTTIHDNNMKCRGTITRMENRDNMSHPPKRGQKQMSELSWSQSNS